MARKPARAKTGKPASPSGTDRERIIAAFMALLGEKSIEQIGFAEIATRANVSLGALRDEFPSTLAIFAAHVKMVDRQVLDGGDGDMAEEPPRERLFDVLMRRIEAMAPHKAAVRSLLRSATRNPGLALALNTMAVRSQQWMLTAADIRASGPYGMVRAQGLALLFTRVLRTFVHDDDDGHARTMAALDRELGRGARWIGLLEDLCRFLPRLRPRRRRRERDDKQGDEATVAV